MGTYHIPEKAGPYCVAPSRSGGYIVQNDRTGKNRVLIPCSDLGLAQELCRRLNEGDHNGTVSA
jgi:hypothetical protein